jgi:hypothetical protein
LVLLAVVLALVGLLAYLVSLPATTTPPSGAVTSTSAPSGAPVTGSGSGSGSGVPSATPSGDGYQCPLDGGVAFLWWSTDGGQLSAHLAQQGHAPVPLVATVSGSRLILTLPLGGAGQLTLSGLRGSTALLTVAVAHGPAITARCTLAPTPSWVAHLPAPPGA